MNKLYLLLLTLSKLKPVQLYGQIKRRIVTALVSRYPNAVSRWLRRHNEPDIEALLKASGNREAGALYEEIETQFAGFNTSEWLDSFERGSIELLKQREELSADSRLWLSAAPAEGSNRLWKMTLSYMHFAPAVVTHGSPAARQHLVHLLESLDPGSTWHKPDTHRDVWSPYAVSQRILSLVGALGMWNRPDMWNRPETAEGNAYSLRVIAAHLSLCVRYLLMNLEFDLLVNHLWKNFVALAVVDSLLPDYFVSRKWLIKSLERAMRRDFLGDGGQVERSAHYHRLSVWDLHLLLATGIGRERAEVFGDYARSAENAGILMTHVDGTCFRLNDSWSETPLPLRYHRSEEHASSGILPETGYAKLAAGNWSVAFDAGALGPRYNPGHGHADQLSVEARYDRRPLIVDPGVPTYSRGDLRSWCRAERSHNGPTVSGYNKALPWASFRVAAFAESVFVTPLETRRFDSTQCRYTVGRCGVLANSGLSMYRGVLVSETGELILVDGWRNSRPKRDNVGEVMFQIDASWAGELLNDHTLRLKSEHGRALTWSVHGAIIDTIASSAYYPEFGRSAAAFTVFYRLPAFRDKGEVATVITPSANETAVAKAFGKASEFSGTLHKMLEPDS